MRSAMPSADGITAPCCNAHRLVKQRIKDDENTRQAVAMLDSQLQR